MRAGGRPRRGAGPQAPLARAHAGIQRSERLLQRLGFEEKAFCAATSSAASNAATARSSVCCCSAAE
ncbi:MAG: hypothetical protein WDM85_12510 [Caulobacteraceae bacterium]